MQHAHAAIKFKAAQHQLQPTVPRLLPLNLPFLPGLQIPDVMRAAAVGYGTVLLHHLTHDLPGLRRFGVGDVDGVAVVAADLAQLQRQGARGQVLADVGQHFVEVAKGGLNHQRVHGQLVHACPQGRVGAGVAGEDPAVAPGAHREAHGGHGVFGGQHFDGFVAHGDGLAGGKGHKPHKGCVGCGDAGEVGPDDVVEDVGLQRGNGGGQGVHVHGGRAACADGVQHQGQGGDVVEVGVGEEHVVDVFHFVQGEVAYAGACVDEYIVTHQERRGAAVARDGTGAAEYTDFHGVVTHQREVSWLCITITQAQGRSTRQQPQGQQIPWIWLCQATGIAPGKGVGDYTK